jgi:hypothetical protein
MILQKKIIIKLEVNLETNLIITIIDMFRLFSVMESVVENS